MIQRLNEPILLIVRPVVRQSQMLCERQGAAYPTSTTVARDLECGSLLPLFPIGGTSLLAVPHSCTDSKRASKLARMQSGSKLPHSKCWDRTSMLSVAGESRTGWSLPSPS